VCYPDPPRALSRLILVLLSLTLFGSFGSWSALPVSAAAGTNTLFAGEQLLKATALVSANGQYSLEMQTDGNLVIYGPGHVALWNTGTRGGDNFFRNQTDGNLVVYSGAGVAQWESRTSGRGASSLVMQDDGNLVLYKDNTTPRVATWISNTAQPAPPPPAAISNHLDHGQRLNGGQNLYSPNGAYSLEMQTDGNLVIYGPGHAPLWFTSTSNSRGAFLVNQDDGNLVLYSATGAPLWYTRTNGRGQSTLRIQDDGNLVLYVNSGGYSWNSGTSSGAVPSGNAQQLAQQILDNPRVIKSGRLVLTDLQDAAAGRVGTSGAAIKASILSAILTIAQNHTVTISAIESGGTGHSSDSRHYVGSAVDFSALDGVALTGRDSGSVTIINAIKNQLPSGSGFGQSQCGSTPPLPSGVTTFEDTCNHLHVQVPR